MVKGKKFAVFDIDGTLIRWQLYHAIADSLVKLGFVSPYIYQVVKDARRGWKNRESTTSFKAYEKKLIETYEFVLKDLNKEQVLRAIDDVVGEYQEQVYRYTRDLIRELKKQKYMLFAISGSQIEIVEKVSRHWGFDDCVGTIYEYKNGKFTGNKVIGSADKATALKGLVEKHGCLLEGSIAVGDSASDIPMLGIVEQPIAFNPEKALFNKASQKRWKVVIERKNMVFELERDNGKYQLAKAD